MRIDLDTGEIVSQFNEVCPNCDKYLDDISYLYCDNCNEYVGVIVDYGESYSGQASNEEYNTKDVE